ncbi:MAG: AAA family ATPase [Bacteroides sp.]|nr:AAA family ATPase [Bacteroides sp.]
MIDYHVDKPKASTVIFLQRFDNEFSSFIKENKLKNTVYHNLTISIYLCLDNGKHRSKDSFELKTNADFSIPNSLSFTDKVSEYLKARKKEFDACIPNSEYLLIDIKYGKDNKTNNTTTSSKDDEVTFYIPENPKYTLDKVILSKEIKDDILEALNVIENKQLIYDIWGFGEIDPYPRSILNFYGPPGTGKTMTANAIANSLNKKILALSYAEIESKYVGEAPKNLTKAFECANKHDAVMFFDEADSFLGKRIQNVTHGSDQALNSLRSQMLMLLESFNGVVIFATNLVSNFDAAFESRILKHIKFELPNKDARIHIIAELIPIKLPIVTPLSVEELEHLAEITEGFSGRELKNAILEVLLRKAKKDGKNAIFGYLDFKEGFEKKKESLALLKKEKTADKEKKILKALSEMPKEELLSKKTQTGESTDIEVSTTTSEDNNGNESDTSAS